MFSEIFQKIVSNLDSAIDKGNELYMTRQRQIEDISSTESKLSSLLFNIPRTADRDRILRVAAKPR